MSLTLLFIILYSLICLTWGVFTAVLDRLYFKEKNIKLSFSIFTALGNAIFSPISIILATRSLKHIIRPEPKVIKLVENKDKILENMAMKFEELNKTILRMEKNYKKTNE